MDQAEKKVQKKREEEKILGGEGKTKDLKKGRTQSRCEPSPSL